MDLGVVYGIVDVRKRVVEGILIFWFGKLGGVYLVLFIEIKNNSEKR